MIPHEYIEELTRRTDIVELVGSYVQLKRKGRLYGGLCPFHSEKHRPSMCTLTPKAFTASAVRRQEMPLALSKDQQHQQRRSHQDAGFPRRDAGTAGGR